MAYSKAFKSYGLKLHEFSKQPPWNGENRPIGQRSLQQISERAKRSGGI